MDAVWFVNLSITPYADALALQHHIVRVRQRGGLNDVLLLLEHPPVLTLGRNARESNLLVSREFLRQRGVEVFRVERGGEVTYHGPGQLVGYPILDLRRWRLDVGWFVHSLEEVLTRTLGDFGIHATRDPKRVGAWVGDAKIAQIGARIEQWVTYHGFSLNVDPNLAHFEWIVPCGLADRTVTSMTRALNQPVEMPAVRARVAARFGEVFGAEMRECSADELRARLAVA